MAKKKKTHIQPISLKKYIIERARSLPIYKCWLLSDSQGSGICDILVAREKKNGNLIFGVYLIDMYCLGLKDTYYKEAAGIEELESSLLFQFEDTKKEIAPNYAFNCIYGAIEYAEDCGISPHGDFKITEYLLDDVDDVEYEDIEFGQNGKPLFMEGPNDDAKKITRILNETLGEDGYKFIKSLNPFGGDDVPFELRDREDMDDFEYDNEIAPEDLEYDAEGEELEGLRELNEKEFRDKHLEIVKQMPTNTQALYSILFILAIPLEDWDLDELEVAYFENYEEIKAELAQKFEEVMKLNGGIEIDLITPYLEMVIENYIRFDGSEFLMLERFVKTFVAFTDMSKLPEKEVLADVNEFMHSWRERRYFTLQFLCSAMSHIIYETGNFYSLNVFQKRNIAQEIYKETKRLTSDIDNEISKKWKEIESLFWTYLEFCRPLPDLDEQELVEMVMSLEKPEG